MRPSFLWLRRIYETKCLQPRALRSIERAQTLSSDKLKHLQEKRLSEILKLAVNKVPFYRSAKGLPDNALMKSDPLSALKKMPLVKKNDIQREPGSFFAEGASRRGLMRWPTSGSSGIPLEVFTNSLETAHCRALVRYGFLQSGAEPGDKLMKLRNMTPSFPDVKKYPTDTFRWYKIDIKNSLDTIIRAIHEVQPHIVYSFPSYLSLLSQYVIDRGLSIPQTRLVCVYGEVTSPASLSLIAKVFRSPVRDTYGTAEFHRIAYQCAQGRYHVIESSVVIEALPADGSEQEGEEILLTSLYHKTMPLIRYRIGDRVVFSKGSCPCGKTGMTLDKIIGRQDDSLILPSGRKISSRNINRLDEIPYIMEYQITQKTKELFEVLVRPMKGFGAAQEEAIRKKILEGCYGESLRIEVRTVSEIERTRGGKLKTIISEIS